MTHEEAIRVVTTLLYNQTGVMGNQQREGVFMAVESLEKQIPKKPNETTRINIGNLYTLEGDCDCGTHLFFRDRYCPNCGQAIDWSEDAKI